MNIDKIIAIVIVLLLFTAAVAAIWCIYMGEDMCAAMLILSLATYGAKRSLW